MSKFTNIQKTEIIKIVKKNINRTITKKVPITQEEMVDILLQNGFTMKQSMMSRIMKAIRLTK